MPYEAVECFWVEPTGKALRTFRRFKHSDEEHLGRAWLKNPEEVVQRTEEKKRAPWSGYWFVNVGESEHRTWEDNVTYGFVAAGHDERYSRPPRKLGVGDEVFAYMAGLGYVGYGVVTAFAVPIARLQASLPYLRTPTTRS